MLASRSRKDRQFMHLPRFLFFVEAQVHFSLRLVHIAGIANELADDPSREKLSSLLSKVSKARDVPSPVSPALTALLLDTQGVWTSPSWTRRFTTIVNSV